MEHGSQRPRPLPPRLPPRRLPREPPSSWLSSSSLPEAPAGARYSNIDSIKSVVGIVSVAALVGRTTTSVGGSKRSHLHGTRKKKHKTGS